MKKSWFAKFGDETSEDIASVNGIRPDVAEAFIAAIRNQVNVEPPRHADDFNALTATIAQTSRVIQHLEAFREQAIVAADETHPLADRKAIAIAAAMPPSRLYRILEKYGRPKNRREA
ncbi:hypothetical protein [Streptomyces sp. 900116325]